MPVDLQLIVDEAMIGCTSRMLLCLSREQQVVYVLGEIFGVTDGVGAELLEISRDGFRQKALAGAAGPSPVHARTVRARQRGESVPVREEDAGPSSGPAISTRTNCCSPAITLTRARRGAEVHDDIEALDAAYAKFIAAIRSSKAAISSRWFATW